jgi:DUF4097 and DUF4098 domain-containing protein YvlB
MSAPAVQPSPEAPQGTAGPWASQAFGDHPPARPHKRSSAATALIWVGGIAAGWAILSVGYQAADWMVATTESSTHEHAAAPVIELIADGDVTVSVGGDSTVTVEETSRSGFRDTTYSADESADRLTVNNACPSFEWGEWAMPSAACKADLDVRVPAGTEVIVKTSSGDISATGVKGEMTLTTSDGDVTITEAGNSVTAQSSSGRIDADQVTGDLYARTSDGSLSLSNVSGSVDAKTTSGKVTVNDVADDVLAVTSDGDVSISNIGGSADAKTTSGKVTVNDVADDVQAVTSDGDVTVSNIGGTAFAKTSSGRVEVSAVLGDVEARSSDGNVTVWGTGDAVALDITTSNGKTTVEGPTDSSAKRSVIINTGSGDVKYLNAK